MTDTIYQNPFVFEKHGQSFSEYIGLCITHFRNEKDENTQRHHILPRCMTGGEYIEERWNWVHLPKIIHKHAHLLLSESDIEHSGLVRAAILMNNLSLRGFEPWNKGKTGIFFHSEETKRKMTEDRMGEKNSMWDKTHTQDAKDKQREKALERETNGFAGKTHTSEANEKNRIAHLNKTATKETRVKMSESQKNSEYNLNRPKKNCPFCDRIIDISNYDKHVKSCIKNPESMKYKKLIEFQINKG